ncbi:hypothetical protein A3L09_03805 [Thermococcus profundus]|uniref:Uncharacterized protein n=1 Tax=Thermococcus profundus TaxID=49899 RepID=A0A2Z2MAI0_THEPR|nr:hypothetical protein [Thermococcus profundus]ASJ02439.1 hypothetical protein A3L09_03805 [Thermococcus profundus]
MYYIGKARSPYGPHKTQEVILEELKKRGFDVSFTKHHWAGDLPFGIVIVEGEKGHVAVRWSLGREFTFELEKTDKETFDEFIEDTVEYTNADSD